MINFTFGPKGWLNMHACLRCGKRTDADYMIWKGGISRALCQACELEEQKADKERERKRKGR
jgi:hypothetical protein